MPSSDMVRVFKLGFKTVERSGITAVLFALHDKAKKEIQIINVFFLLFELIKKQLVGFSNIGLF